MADPNHLNFAPKHPGLLPPRRVSRVWEHFEIQKFEENGVEVTKAVCIRADCKAKLSYQPHGGTGHLVRHIVTHAKRDEARAADV